MQILLLEIPGSINTSLQIGDDVYYSSVDTVPNSGIETSGANIMYLGTVTSIDYNLSQVSVMFDNSASIPPPNPGDYIMFGKNKAVNSSSLIGYYADVKFVNYRTDRVELFAVSSEVSESSK